MKITAVLYVDEIESALSFWVDRLGFEKTAEVPEDGRVVFAMLTRGGTELMLQTVESVRKDVPAFAPKATAKGACLYVEVDDFADARKRLEGYPIAMPERTTSYGMREIGVIAPGGHNILFGAKA